MAEAAAEPEAVRELQAQRVAEAKGHPEAPVGLISGSLAVVVLAAERARAAALERVMDGALRAVGQDPEQAQMAPALLLGRALERVVEGDRDLERGQVVELARGSERIAQAARA